MEEMINQESSPKVLLAVTTIAVGGGAEKVATMVANGLHKRRIGAMLLTQYADPNEHVVNVPRVNLGPSLKNFHSLPRWRRVLTKLTRAWVRTLGTAHVIKKEKIQTVISFLEESNFYSIFAKLLFRLPIRIIVSVRMDPTRYGSVYKFLIRKLYRHADVVVAVTKGIEETLRTEFGLSNVHTIYNPIDIQIIEERAEEALPEPWKFLAGEPGYYINVARLTYQKGQWHLLRSFKRLLERRPDAKLVILGQGEYHRELPKLAERLGIAKSVYFVGQQENIYPFLRHAGRFVFTSLFEGLPNSVLEALAMNLPIVSVDSTSGMRELIAPELTLSEKITYPYQASRGILVEPFPDEERATLFEPKDGPYGELARILADPPRTIDTKYQMTDEFSPDSVIDEWAALV